MKQKIETDQIIFIKSFDDYIIFHLEEKESIPARKTLKALLDKLLKRVHSNSQIKCNCS